jgi:mono/diheme cytochrome c family protein
MEVRMLGVEAAGDRRFERGGLRLVVALAMAGLAGCESGSPMSTEDAGRASPDAGDDEVTYYEDMRPLFVEHCTTCHVEGGIGPFSLLDYDAAFEEAETIRDVTEARIMPPFLADNSGDCNTWSNYRGLSDEEIALIGAWVDAGAPEGDPTTPEPPASELPSLSTVDATLRMPETFTTNGGLDDEYRCFVVDAGLAEDRYLTGYDVRPGNLQRVHHVIVYSPTNEAAAAAAVSRDMMEGSPTDGYTCYGGAGVNAMPVVLWAPGTGATRFPRGTGIQLTAGRPLIIQVHYNNNVAAGTPATDLTEVDLSLAETASPAYMPMLADLDLNLPPREAEVVESARTSFSMLPVPSVRVWGVFPHMHTLGRTLRVDLNRPDANECLIDLPRWDFHWQMAYWLDDPLSIRAEDAATITCTFDTRSRSTMTTFGEGTEDEMCLAFAYVTL